MSERGVPPGRSGLSALSAYSQLLLLIAFTAFMTGAWCSFSWIGTGGGLITNEGYLNWPLVMASVFGGICVYLVFWRGARLEERIEKSIKKLEECANQDRRVH